jgi:6-phosphogluconolactonase
VNTTTNDHPGELQVFPDAEQLAVAGAELFVSGAAESIASRGRFRVALSGGSTPRHVYELLASPAFRTRVAWERVDVFLGDERYVPSDDKGSNYRMAAETLLRHVPLPKANVHRVMTEIAPPEAAAQAYEETIRQNLAEPRSVPQLDLIYLGLGTNGHTASLFPGTSALEEKSRLVVAVVVEAADPLRITMTVPLLNRGRTVAFLIEGKQKAPVLHEVLLGPRDPARLPAQLIAPEGKLLWMLDEAAGAELAAIWRGSASSGKG